MLAYYCKNMEAYTIYYGSYIMADDQTVPYRVALEKRALEEITLNTLLSQELYDNIENKLWKGPLKEVEEEDEEKEEEEERLLRKTGERGLKASNRTKEKANV